MDVDALDAMLASWRKRRSKPPQGSLNEWREQIAQWSARRCFAYKADSQIIKPQYAIERLHEEFRRDTDRMAREIAVVQKLTELGVDVWGTTAEEFRKEIAIQIPHQGEMAKLAGVKKQEAK